MKAEQTLIRVNAKYETDKSYINGEFRIDLYIYDSDEIIALKKEKRKIVKKPLEVAFRCEEQDYKFTADYYDSGKYQKYYKLQLLSKENEDIEAEVADFLNKDLKVSIRIDEVEQEYRETLISSKQNGLLHALIRDLGTEIGYMSMDVAKKEFKAMYADEKGIEFDTVSKITRKEAREFIDWLFEIALDNGVTLKMDVKQLYNDLDMIEKFVVHCLKRRICCISGLPGADIHHYEQLGHQAKGYDDSEHLVLPLNRIYHGEAHTSLTKEEFLEKYHLKAVPFKFAQGSYTLEEMKEDIENHKKTKNIIRPHIS